MINITGRFKAIPFFIAAATFAVVSFMASAPANAGVFVCNETGMKLHVAVGWKEGNAWNSRGWYTLAPQECKNPIAGAMENQIFYYYARNTDNSIQWKDGAESAHFCTTRDRFHFSYAVDPPCEGFNFRKVHTSQPDQHTLRLTETQMDPAEAARNCVNTMRDGRDAFIKCWTRNAATSTQRKILECWDKTKTYASFAVCANQGYLNRDAAAVADCSAKYSDNANLVTCLTNGRLSEQESRFLNCAVSSQGNLASMGSCALAGQLPPEQRRLVECVATNRGSYTNMGLCAAGGYVNPEHRRIADCVVKNSNNYVGMGVCAAGNNLTPEQQVFVQCAVTTGGQPYAFAGCVGTQLTLNELQKCMTDGIGGDGCFGKNNEAVKFVRNAWKDVTRGPGPSNDLVGRDGALVRTVRNNIAGPAQDLARGELGRSDASVWRQVGLPPVKLPKLPKIRF
ncbi:putative membrane protein [Bradyrhizobium sp. R2.2-H]|uniref:DUF1036 domain-containing protein n=1 Tax=unclassified Bradyrhizobium TaxID=2631580 RepID=UPI00105017E2|nr:MULTISPECIES: DUF1036 domain-containing protein [unclassified Bradyrhizobium]TCU58364.1 putative membrane protein [Bradyrhizobium sp. Y-H1]TCU62999.1 putative membrane protein [Bradyrhizobium sp. R2.2-H]